MNDHTAILLWGPLLTVLLADFVLMKFRYRQTPAIARILRFEHGTKLDSIFWCFFYVIAPKATAFVMWITVPGLALIGLSHLAQTFGIKGIFEGVLPKAGLLAVILWLLVSDLARYVSHVLLHKVPALWEFHKIHHATTEFNVITGNRVSLAEKFFHDVVEFALLGLVLGVPAPHVILWVLFIRNVLNLLQHSDLPWNYGVFGYVFVSPQFHRMHHSSHGADADANYGTIFAWDYLFGTVSPRYLADPNVANACKLGLSDAAETDEINRHWFRSSLNGTGFEYLLKLIHRIRGPAGTMARGEG